MSLSFFCSSSRSVRNFFASSTASCSSTSSAAFMAAARIAASSSGSMSPGAELAVVDAAASLAAGASLVEGSASLGCAVPGFFSSASSIGTFTSPSSCVPEGAASTAAPSTGSPGDPAPQCCRDAGLEASPSSCRRRQPRSRRRPRHRRSRSQRWTHPRCRLPSAPACWSTRPPPACGWPPGASRQRP